jgi:hypothetical protein
LTAIRRTAATVFAEPLPITRPLGVDEMTSYAEWIQSIDRPS